MRITGRKLVRDGRRGEGWVKFRRRRVDVYPWCCRAAKYSSNGDLNHVDCAADQI